MVSVISYIFMTGWTKIIGYSELSEEGKFYLHLFCVNPAGCLQEYMGKGNSTILFSATFLPINYYKKLLSAAKDDYAIYANLHLNKAKDYCFWEMMSARSIPDADRRCTVSMQNI